MELLERPQELLDTIIAHHIYDNGVAATWQLRGTCSKYPSICFCMTIVRPSGVAERASSA
jgi:hypothetical protein